MEASKVISEFGQHLKKVRNSSGLSQEKLAFLSGLHPTYISQENLEDFIWTKNYPSKVNRNQ
ncbi:MAG: helix-turn-helix transcriptional regulator [Candidatus Kapaibacterium sp.]